MLKPTNHLLYENGGKFFRRRNHNPSKSMSVEGSGQEGLLSRCLSSQKILTFEGDEAQVSDNKLKGGRGSIVELKEAYKNYKRENRGGQKVPKIVLLLNLGKGEAAKDKNPDSLENTGGPQEVEEATIRHTRS